ncbi:hypothetical protein P8843_14120 [Bacillus inaquosorum]|uniref:hypothetical protein n=1 Tax=Bacillus inaquosorum TaxID=483913 RepID=UPI001414F504|nr:hypothetical protein [Bacillus inaquosorum]MCY7900335.1 hypothetical protein [Bacillus inaquosorum]MCY7950738.1 hypothetical protein [Bacillus inaquosorum]MCY7985347.1 hypothetical protein [Bacillus inaquosorum]MCY8053907.1 hypothetical protein [Bacillus inaquosorum]MCY8138707.1 hypothetical protein [Bacillus inaquosorum]
MNEIRGGIYDACIGHHDRLPAVIQSVYTCLSLSFSKAGGEEERQLLNSFKGSDNT